MPTPEIADADQRASSSEKPSSGPRKTFNVPELLHAEREEKQRKGQQLESFSRLHLRLIVVMQVCSFLGFSSMLAVEWIAALRAAEAEQVTSLTLLGKDVLYYDEQLTMSCRMYALTGNLKWRDQYHMYVSPIETALKDIQRKAPEISKKFEETTVTANDVLLDLETQALQLRAANKSLAVQLLFGENYMTNKALLNVGLETLDSDLQAKQTQHQDVQSWWGPLSVSVIVIAFLTECASTIGIQKLDRKLAQKTEACDMANQAYNYSLRSRFLDDLGSVSELQGLEAGKECSHKLTRKASQTAEVIAPKLRRIAWIAWLMDMIGILALGIPSALTLIALKNAEEADSMQGLVTHMRMVEYYDLALTSSAALCALTGDKQWNVRYDKFVLPIEEEIDALQKLEPEMVDSFVQQTTEANNVLIDLEGKALDVCTVNTTAAQGFIFNIEYDRYKGQLSDAIANLATKVEQKKQEEDDAADKHETLSRSLMIACTLLIVGSDIIRVVCAVWEEDLSGSVNDGEDEEEMQLMEDTHALVNVCLDRVQNLQTQLADAAVYSVRI